QPAARDRREACQSDDTSDETEEAANEISDHACNSTCPDSEALEKGGRTMKSLRSLISLLNLHFAGVALLLILNLVLAVRLFLAWSTLRSAGADQMSQQQTAL